MEDSTAVVVHHHERNRFAAQEREGVEIVKKGQVANEGGDGFSRARGNPCDRGDVAVDAARATVSEDLGEDRGFGFNAGIEIPNRHGISEEEKRGVRSDDAGDGAAADGDGAAGDGAAANSDGAAADGNGAAADGDAEADGAERTAAGGAEQDDADDAA